MKKLLMLSMLCFLAGGCAPKQKVEIDENAAIAAANAFLLAVMQGEYQAAYDQHMSPGIKFHPNSTLEQFTADWKAIADKYGKLQKATFTAYQLVPGRRVVQLYYNVVHEQVENPVEYHLVLEQSIKNKWTIFLIDIGNEKAYPSDTVAQPAIKLKKDGVIEIVPE